MYARYVQKGEAIDHMPDTAVAAGDVVVVGNLIGIARLDIPAGVLGALAVVGVYDVAKAAGAADETVRVLLNAPYTAIVAE